MTVIIPAAGYGSRLKSNCPKPLTIVNKEPILYWQLTAIPQNIDVILVVGYRGKEIEQVAKTLRKDINVVYNNDFSTTGVMHSVLLGASSIKTTDNDILILDGDLIVNKTHIEHMLEQPAPCIACRLSCGFDSPVYAITNSDNKVIAFSRERKTDLEWACYCKINKHDMINTTYIYESIENVLPASFIVTDAPEIDTKEDILIAERKISTWKISTK